MAFLLKNGAVFLHIPKTGGTWIKHVLQDLDLIQAPLGHQHSDWDRAFWHDKLHGDLKVMRYLVRRAIRSPRAQARINPDCFKFCFVREPLSWYQSYWRFMESLDWNWQAWGDEKNPYRWHPCAMINCLRSSDFNTFVHKVNKKRPGFVTEMYGWYVRPGIGFVGRQEHLLEDMGMALALMGLQVGLEKKAPIARQNETPCHIPVPQWDPVLRKKTLQLEYAGYSRFGYPVDGGSPGATQPEASRAA
jgi:hypothetical protein